jgi:hypothetical protein
MVGGIMGSALHWLYGDKLDVFRAAYRKKLSGSFLGFDVTRVFTRKR